MIVTIHQPEHLPWLGFFNKVSQADVLVLLDTVQYRKNYFQNRNRILGPNGPVWLTVPVIVKGHTTRLIKDMEINNSVVWRGKHWKTISYAYKKHPFFGMYAHFFENLYREEWSRLEELNNRIIRYFLDALSIKTEVLKASDLGIYGTSSELLLDICLKTGATTYLAGQSGPDYLDESIFAEAGLTVHYHDFSHPTYTQRGAQSFISHLSTLDLLFNCGPMSAGVIHSGVQG